MLGLLENVGGCGGKAETKPFPAGEFAVTPAFRIGKLGIGLDAYPGCVGRLGVSVDPFRISKLETGLEL